MNKFWEMILEKEIHKDVGAVFVLTLFVTAGGILISQAHWPEGAREVYYAHSGALYDALCLVLWPTVTAFFVGAVELAWQMSSITEGE